MMVIGGVIVGALLGAYKAKKRGGGLADMLQYAAVYGIIFGLLLMVASIAAQRFMA